MGNMWYRVLFVFTLAFFLPMKAQAFETRAKQALLIDMASGTVLFEHNANQLMPPSSMTKIMTVYMILKRLKTGELTFEDRFKVSKFAWSKGGSRMFVEVDSNVRIDDLLRGIIVQSGNDASIVMAEGLSGNEAVFAAEMTKTAHDLGATNTTFKNATGLPDPLHLTTAHDLAVISQKLVNEFPEYYKYFSEKEYTYNNIRQYNRNPLLYRVEGVDGIKTGWTEAGGFGLVGSAVKEQNGVRRRLLLVVNGLKSKSERASESEKLMNWGFNYYRTLLLFKPGEVVEKAKVWLGDKAYVPMVVKEDVYYTLPRVKMTRMKVEVVYEEPVTAPIKVGQRIGTLVVSAPEEETFEVPLYAGEKVDQAMFFDRIKAAIYYLFWGHNAGAKSNAIK
jgi:D-alanyl-D-alanine carboxypeptidase (penicillin-binding protein 5/6)